ncbi:MAG TPA: flagellar hook-length control protein FliK [Luteibacter sp.]|nr:flagellar hook-length control protein FliK [Luteibacter sp.]
MTNATLALNVSRPATPATPPANSRDQDDASSSKRFDAALDAAHAQVRDPREQSTPSSRPSHASSSVDDTASSAKSGNAKADHASDDDQTKKDDDTSSDDTSIAATMLSLIGVPPQVTTAAAKVLDVAKGSADTAGVMPGALPALLNGVPGVAATAPGLTGVLPGTAAGVQAAADDLAGVQGATPSMLAAVAPDATMAAPLTAPSFASLLAGTGLAATKDDGSSVDPANPSPMPFAHPQLTGQASGSVVQVQATQVATSPQFAQELGEQIAWMGSGDVKEARIKLHPEELGSMDVRVNLDGGKVNVAIMAQHPAAVHAVQQTLSQLDSMLAHHGLSLGQADVGQRQAEPGGDGSANGQGSSGQGTDGNTTGGAETIATTRVSRGLVDEGA